MINDFHELNRWKTFKLRISVSSKNKKHNNYLKPENYIKKLFFSVRGCGRCLK